MRSYEHLSQSDYEVAKYTALREAEVELDTRTDVVWVDGQHERCTHQTPTKSSGRLMRCSDEGTWLKLRTYENGRKMPVGFFCETHRKEHL